MVGFRIILIKNVNTVTKRIHVYLINFQIRFSRKWTFQRNFVISDFSLVLYQNSYQKFRLAMYFTRTRVPILDIEYLLKRLFIVTLEKSNFYPKMIRNFRHSERRKNVDEETILPPGITFPAPFSPYPSSGGMVNFLFSPTHISTNPWSQPLITWPTPSWNVNGWSLSKL